MATDNPDYAGPEGNRLRALAQSYAEERGQCFSQSTQAFESGDKARAKELSDKGKIAGQKMEESNKQAAEVILKFRNDGHPETYLDLHGLYLEEAMTAFQDRLQKLQNLNEDLVFEVIPGAGNHSKNKAIIKPKVIEEIQKRKLNFEEKNAGSLLVHLTASGGKANAAGGEKKAGVSTASKQSESSRPAATTGSEETEPATTQLPAGSSFGCCIVM
jgi:DNA-nicking Smr family endonuclease